MEKETYRGNNRLLWGICLAVSTYWLFTMATGIIMPSVAKTFQVSEGALTTPISLAGLLSGSLIVVAGHLADKYGRKRLTVLGLAFNLVGSLLLVIAPVTIIFSLGRVLQGVSAALIMPATLSLIKIYYDGAKRQRAISYWSIASWGGAGLSNLFGGFITTVINWQALFIISCLVSIISYLLIRPVPESASKTSEKGFDFVGLFLLITDLLGLNVLITHFSSGVFSKGILVGLFIYVLASTFILLKTERHLGSRAILDLAIFKNKSFNGSTFSNFLLNFTAGCTFVYVTFLQNKFHLSAMDAGVFTLGYLCTVVFFVRQGEHIMQKLGSGRLPMLLGSFIAFLGIFFVSFTQLSEIYYLIVSFVGLAIMGIGMGMYATPSTDMAVADLPNEKSATGSGVYKMASSLGGSFGVAVGGSLYALNATMGYVQAAQFAFIAMYVSALLAFVSIYLFVPKIKMSEK